MSETGTTPGSGVRTEPALLSNLHALTTVRHVGRVVQAFGTSLTVSGLPARIGQRCKITDKESGRVLLADVVGLRDGLAILFPLGNLTGVAVDSAVTVDENETSIPVSDAMCGSVLNGLGESISDFTFDGTATRYPLESDSPNPLSRPPIREKFVTGVKSIDAFLTVGEGQRLGIFAMAGGGKSTLLAMLAKYCVADVIVIGLIGERGREVREFIEHDLGEEGLKRSVLVVSTSDRPAMERIKAGLTATAVAEGFRDQGKRVLLLMDSVTRYGRALREVGLSIGEPPVRRGFPPSVFAELPRLFERTGNNEKGSITAFYTVLAEDESGTDPIAEETRSILDGHIILSRELGEQGHYPAIDVLASVSRVFPNITDQQHQQAATHLRSLLAKYKEMEFLIQVGEYEPGNDAVADEAVAKVDQINPFLKQATSEVLDIDQTLAHLQELCQ